MLTRFRFLSIWVVAILYLGCSPAEEAPDAGGGGEGATTELAADPYNCTGAFPDDFSEQSQVGADSFSWNSFLAVTTQGATPAWKEWYSTVDLIECNQDGGPIGGTCEGQRYVPSACKALYDQNALPIIDQVGKVDDGFEEAKTQGLSHDPVIASNGAFLRYQIVISPGTYDFIASEGYQQEAVLEASGGVNFPCEPDADVYSWAMSLKLAWMPMTGTLPTDSSNYYTQDMLVYTPGYRNSTGEDSCEQVTMGLVGMHLVRKTTSQPAWVWATFEHNLNAPQCTTEPDSGYVDASNPKQQGNTNENCPASVGSSYNFYPASCTSPPATDSACGPCNKGWSKKYPYGGVTEGLAQNGAEGQCVNPDVNKASWCLDQGPYPTYGTSMLCRQVEPAGYGYSGSTFAETEPNVACRPSSGVWSNYDLISTQWAQTGGGSPIPDNCSENVQGIMVGYDVSGNTRLRYPDKIVPATANIVGEADPLATPPGTTSSPRSYLANTSMESYERSNCMGCHAKSTINESGQLGANGSNGTDFVYFLGLEVPGYNAN